MARGIPPTVGNFFMVLSSLITQYDVKESAREMKRQRGHSNIYRLGHLLKAVHEVEDEVLAKVGKEETMTPDIASLLVESMQDHFTVSHKADNFDLAPCRSFVKQLEAYLTKGKNPSMVG